MWSPAALVALVSGLAAVAVCANIQIFVCRSPQLTLRPGEPGALLDVRLWWSEATARRVLEGLGPEGRQANRRMYWMVGGDMWFPVCYATCLTALLWLAWPGVAVVIALPALTCACDIAENVCVTALIDSFGDGDRAALVVDSAAAQSDGPGTAAAQPAFPRWAVRMGPVATLCKWLLLSLSTALLLGRWAGVL